MAPNGRQTGTILGRALVALALAVLALLPPGVMPARVGDAMTVVICTGDGPLTLVTDSQGRPVAPADGTDAKAPCAFALLAATATLPEAQALPLPVARIRPFDPARRPPTFCLHADAQHAGLSNPSCRRRRRDGPVGAQLRPPYA